MLTRDKNPRRLLHTTRSMVTMLLSALMTLRRAEVGQLLRSSV